MPNRLQIFTPRYNNEELEQEFNDFFFKNGLSPLFTNEHRAGEITVTYVDARSVINTSGSYHKTLVDFANYLAMANDNKTYGEAVFKILYEARSFQGLMRSIRNIMKHIDTIFPEHKFNSWNIVFYTKELF